jgi:hypothetical protein
MTGVTTGDNPGAGAAGRQLAYVTPDAQKKLEEQLPPSVKDLAQGTGYSFSYTGPGRVLILINSIGQPLRPIPDVIDETDELWVGVVDYEANMADIALSIAGCNRPPVEARVFGTTTPQPTSAKSEAPPVGDIVFRDFGKCAATDTGLIVTVKSASATSTVTIPVNPVYRFTVGLGLGGDLTKTSSFGVVTKQGSTIATINETNNRIGLTGLLYVGWFPWGRDFRKISADYILQRVVLFAGLNPQDLKQALIIGGGVNLTTGLDVLFGWRALNKVTELQSGSGLGVGSPFDQPASSLPTAQVWKTGGFFFGVGVTNALLAKLH